MCKHRDAGGAEAAVDIPGKRTAHVDYCIAALVRALNGAGFITVASCCGHGNRPGNIALADGRELIIVKDYDDGRKVDTIFPDIHGKPHPRQRCEGLRGHG